MIDHAFICSPQQNIMTARIHQEKLFDCIPFASINSTRHKLFYIVPFSHNKNLKLFYLKKDEIKS